VGAGIGSLVGGWLLEAVGASAMWGITGLSIIIGWVLYGLVRVAQSAARDWEGRRGAGSRDTGCEEAPSAKGGPPVVCVFGS
jgi:hypothetical protein